MAGFFGTISTTSCVNDLFYGTDYHSHLGTRRAGMATYDQEKGFKRSIHNIQNSHFRTKFEHELDEFAGNAGIFIFLIVLGVMVALINKAGGSAAFGAWAEKNIKTR